MGGREEVWALEGEWKRAMIGRTLVGEWKRDQRERREEKVGGFSRQECEEE